MACVNGCSMSEPQLACQLHYCQAKVASEGFLPLLKHVRANYATIRARCYTLPS